MKMFDVGIGKTRVIGLPYGEKNCDDMLSRFHLIPERNGQTDGRTDRQICYDKNAACIKNEVNYNAYAFGLEHNYVSYYF